MHPEHSAAASATRTNKLGLFRIGWLQNQPLFLIFGKDRQGLLPRNFSSDTMSQGSVRHAASSKTGFLSVCNLTGIAP